MFTQSEVGAQPFVIAEVGQNHQGDLNLALEYIKVFATEGANAIKFQTRNNKILFSEEAFNKRYDSENSFADTYGTHREKLELEPEWLPILKAECEKYDVKFMSTPFDEMSLELLVNCGVDILKIASFDLGNLPFISRIGATRIPVALSTGGGNFGQIKSSVDLLRQYHDDIAVLHCVSEYPCEYNRLGLGNIQILRDAFPDITIGNSDHFNGILSGPVAYLQGSRVFEKHVTLNRGWKGTDHGFSLERGGFRRFVRDIKRVGAMFSAKPESELGSEFVFKKLGKSLVARSDIKVGESISLTNLSGTIFSEIFIPVRQSSEVIGRVAIRNIVKGAPISFDDFE